MGSAAYWFGKYISRVVRGSHYALGYEHPTFHLLMADDDAATGIGPLVFRSVGLTLLYMAIMRVPVHWGKVRGSAEYDWAGFWVDLAKYQIRISRKQHEWCLK